MKPLKAGGKPIPTKRASTYFLQSSRLLLKKNYIVITLHKKGDTRFTTDINIYNLFAKVVCNKLTIKLDDFQPVEQSGFRSSFSTIDFKQTMEKCYGIWKITISCIHSLRICVWLEFRAWRRTNKDRKKWCIGEKAYV